MREERWNGEMNELLDRPANISVWLMKLLNNSDVENRGLKRGNNN